MARTSMCERAGLSRRLGKRFVWTAAKPRTSGGADEAYEALRWLGRRLAFEQWFDDVRASRAGDEAA